MLSALCIWRRFFRPRIWFLRNRQYIVYMHNVDTPSGQVHWRIFKARTRKGAELKAREEHKEFQLYKAAPYRG
jgi:hypothetical protein